MFDILHNRFNFAAIDRRFVISTATETETVQSALVADVITEILENLSARDLLSALLVSREWCQVAVPMYWKAPFSYTKKRSMAALKIYELFLERGSSTLLGTKEDSTRGAVQETPLYDYPLFLKELNYTNLLELGESVEAILQILQMLTNRGIRLNTFVMDNTGTNSEIFYGIWTAPRYAPIFSSLIHVEIHTPFLKNNVMKTLANNCTRLSHLDINLYDNSSNRVIETFYYLKKLLSLQQCPLNLRLVFPNGPGKMLMNTLQSQQLESFKRLELVKWNFNGCEWRWLKMCPNLTEFAITSPPQTQVSDILGTIYENYRLKLSKNYKITTAHWHFDKDDGVSSMSSFYFHQAKPLMEPYYDT